MPPTLRYFQGQYYLVCTNITENKSFAGNFLMTAKDPAGPWSDPIWLSVPGIDPSLFEDPQSGQIYYLGTADHHIYLASLDLESGQTGTLHELWSGTGGCDPEGPHLYFREGYYYLVISEGGTSYGHMLTVARATSLTGPYLACPHNPVLSNRSTDLPIQAVGHADLVEDHQHQWWAVCLGVHPIRYPFSHLLGRETCLIPVTWSKGWPELGDNGHVLTTMEAPLPHYPQQKPFSDADWVSLYTWSDQLITQQGTAFTFHPNRNDLTTGKPLAFISHRQTSLTGHLTVEFSWPVSSAPFNCGITCFLNRHHYYALTLEQQGSDSQLVVTRTLGSLTARQEWPLPLTTTSLTLSLRYTPDWYTFGYDFKNTFHPLSQGETRYLTTEVGGVFTGIMLGAFAQQTTPAPCTVHIHPILSEHD